jgi:LCP family protein required for cell wall assembly
LTGGPARNGCYNLSIRDFVKNRMRVAIRTRGDAIFLSVCIAWGILITFILTGMSTGYYAYEASGGTPLLKEWLIAGPVPEPKPTWQVLGRNQLSVLIIGTDEHLEYDRGRSDTIIWAFLDFRRETADVLSIPRDLIVWLPKKRNPHFDKICHAYSYGGSGMVEATVERFLGVDIDQVVKVDYGGFIRIIDTLGGVEIDVEQDMDYDDRRGDLHIHIKKGRQTLDGRKSLDYVRFRHDKHGDLGRIERQHEFLAALKQKGIKLQQFGRTDDLAAIVAQSINIEPGMDLRDIAAILLFFTKLNDDTLRFHSVPIGMDVIYNDLASLTPAYTKLDALMRDILKTDEIAPDTGGDEIEGPDEPVPLDFEDL